jgi:hypothetical protein
VLTSTFKLGFGVGCWRIGWNDGKLVSWTVEFGRNIDLGVSFFYVTVSTHESMYPSMEYS